MYNIIVIYNFFKNNIITIYTSIYMNDMLYFNYI